MSRTFEILFRRTGLVTRGIIFSSRRYKRIIEYYRMSSTVSMDVSTVDVHSNNKKKNDRLFWKIGEPIPAELDLEEDNIITATFIPRTVAWITVDEYDDEVVLLDGYTATCYTPPSVHFAASALPKHFVDVIQRTERCSISAATIRESDDTFQKAWNGGHPQAFKHTDLGLQFTKSKDEYPPTLSHTPIKMHCSVENITPFEDDDDDAMLVLIVENVIVDGSVLSPPTSSMVARNITAKIDAGLIQSVAHLGYGIIRPMTHVKSMPRPVKVDNKDDNNNNNNNSDDIRTQWTSTELNPVVSGATERSSDVTKFPTMEWNWRIDGASCPLGFNPTTAIIMPRPIGWISTYTKIGRLKHLAPYSFTIDVARGKYPKIGFSAYRKGGTEPKDAHKNAVETGYFCVNMVTQELAVPMNYSAAELIRTESEFELSGLLDRPAVIVDAPTVAASKIIYECKYLKTVDVASFSIVIGEIVAVSIDKSILSTDKRIDLERLQPIARLGYMDEYGIFY